MKHYIPLQLDNGAWGVCYGNHRGEFISVMECPTLESAYQEAQQMTVNSIFQARALLQHAPGAESVSIGGNRYLRRFQQ